MEIENILINLNMLDVQRLLDWARELGEREVMTQKGERSYSMVAILGKDVEP